MPAFNHAAFVSEAVESVLSQSFGDFELVVRDDCSKDETPVILRRWQGVDSRLKILDSGETNVGVRRSLELLIANSAAPLVATIGSDDRWHPERLAQQVPRTPHDGWSVCQMRPIDQKGRPTYLAPQGYATIPSFRELLTWNTIPAPGVIFSRHLYKASGGFTDNDFEDWSLWARMRALATPVRLPEELVDYRFLSSSLSQTLYGSGHLFEGARQVALDCLRAGRLTPGQRAIAEEFERVHDAISVLLQGGQPSFVLDGLGEEAVATCLAFIDASLPFLLHSLGLSSTLSFLAAAAQRSPAVQSEARRLRSRAVRVSWVERPLKNLGRRWLPGEVRWLRGLLGRRFR
jgi:glycosyltransferase involved in cell wall biosynthesis